VNFEVKIIIIHFFSFLTVTAYILYSTFSVSLFF